MQIYKRRGVKKRKETGGMRKNKSGGEGERRGEKAKGEKLS